MAALTAGQAAAFLLSNGQGCTVRSGRRQGRGRREAFQGQVRHVPYVQRGRPEQAGTQPVWSDWPAVGAGKQAVESWTCARSRAARGVRGARFLPVCLSPPPPRAQVAGFKYTDANKNSGVTWTTQAMFDYLANPKKYIKGTNMAFPGFKKQQDAADVTAYLKSMG